MIEKILFEDYWSRKNKAMTSEEKFTLSRWFQSEELCEIEKIYYESIKDCKTVLDVGAGDLRIKNKFLKNGLRAAYHTQDINQEHLHTYLNLDDIHQKYDAILCLDVLEHMPLSNGICLIKKMISLLNEKGIIIIQTPNGRCIRNPLGWDMTHQHMYNLNDLYSFFSSQGFTVNGYRVFFHRKLSLIDSIFSFLGKIIITKLIGADYADNIAIIAKKTD